VLAYELASGGMATVFLARAVDPGGVSKLVAIKRIHKHLARSREFVDMFLDEARIAARITHPNVCSVFELGEVDGSYFLAMEFLAGQTVGGFVRAIERAQLSSAQRAGAMVHVLAQACEGLHAAHELRGADGEPLEVVHRDISPSNLFVTYDGAVKVVDFGIARARNRVTRTEAGTVKGKLGYLAPEQIGGAGTHDRRGDVWAMGVVAWEVLVGRRLFRRESELDTAVAIAHDDIEPPSVARPGLPAALDAPILAALARDPAERTPTARMFGRALTQALPQGHGFGAADLAELMDRLYPEAHAQALRLAESVLAESTPEPASVGPAGADDPTVDLVVDAARVPSAPPRRWPAALAAALFAVTAAIALWWIAPATGPAHSLSEEPRDAGSAPHDARATDASIPHASVTPDASPAAPSDTDNAVPPPTLQHAQVRALRAEAQDRPDASVSTNTEPVTASAPPAGRGSLSVIARGASGFTEVWIDGERVGYAPLQRSLATGQHEVEVRASTGEVRRSSVVVDADEIERVVARFDTP
jgi:serine/threonine-protein kinase